MRPEAKLRYQFRELSIIIFSWILSLYLYITIRYWGIDELSGSFFLIQRIAFTDFYIIAIIGGIVIGLVTGVFETFFYPETLTKRSFTWVVLFKSIYYLVALFCVIVLLTFLFFLVKEFTISESLENAIHFISTDSFLSLLLYLGVIGIIINYVRLISNRFGPGVHWNMVVGKYHKPKEEELIFMFLDLKSSTSIAEQLGHIKFSRFLQDYYRDLSKVLLPYNAQVYQYVGDEAVITWTLKGGLRRVNCIRLFFAFERIIKRKKGYYQKRYNVVPEFKASLNSGKVTIAEVGEIKSEIAYHGDVVNTASRIQEQCNKFGQKLLISEDLERHLHGSPALNIKFIDHIKLFGKEKPLSIYSVELVN